MRSIKRVCIAGAGSIGSLYAGFLAEIADVTVLTRREEHAEILNKEGLNVSGKANRHASLRASTDPSELGEVDLVIIATKTTHVETCLKQLYGHFPGAMVMLVQNGIGCEAMVPDYGDWPIISAVTFMAGTRLSDDHVSYELDTETWNGPWAQGTATGQDVQAVTGILNRAGLKAQAFNDLLPAQWSKLIFNSSINSISAATDLPFCAQYIQRHNLYDLGHLVYVMIEEGKAVARACNIHLHQDPWQMVLEAVQNIGASEKKARVPSMLADVRAGQQTEIDWITGAVVREAEKKCIPVPLHETLYRIIKGREMNWDKNSSA